MYYEVANRLVISSGETTFSQAINMGGGNAVLANATFFNVTATTGTVSITLQEGNDLDNWTDNVSVGGTIAGTVASYGTMKLTSIASQYVRLKYTMTGSSLKAVLSAALNTAQL